MQGLQPQAAKAISAGRCGRSWLQKDQLELVGHRGGERERMGVNSSKSPGLLRPEVRERADLASIRQHRQASEVTVRTNEGVEDS